MKKKILLTLSVGAGLLSYGQCEIDIPETVCLGSLLDLTIDGSCGVYTGDGVDGNVFDATEAGLGMHTITFESSDDPYCVNEDIPYSIEAISGATVSLGDDAVSGDLLIGFDFTYFGNTYSAFKLSSNGFMTFPGEFDNGCCSGEVMPNSSGSEPQNNIGICWDDLNPPTGGTMSYETIGTAPNRILVADWNGVRHFSSTNVITGQIKLFETSNCVEVHITTQNDAANIHTLGMQNISGTAAAVAPGKNGTPWIASNYAVSFCPNSICSASVEVTVAEGPSVTATVDLEEICLGEEIILDGSGTADTYSFGPGIELGEPYTPLTPGANIFILAGTDTDLGCIATDFVNVFVHDIPSVYAGDDFTVCEDDEFILSGIGDAVTYVWDGGIVDGEPTLQDAGTVTYTVTGTNEGGCEASSSINVEALDAPTGTGEVTMMTGVAFDGEIDFTPSGGTGGPYTFLWSNGATTEDISALGVGTFTVTVSDGVCDSNVEFLVDSQAGIALNELENLKVYPNPVVDFVTVEFEGTYNWTLIDNAGKIISTGVANGKEQISMENLATGNYLMNVEVDGKQSTVSVVKK